ncbi:hypothetical protein IWQ60_002044 [Tieghemiomyces parasiticus]|uniref:Uncharacterized protein n=1 Tax=Tieghemiomyces parasiticus TaxID=78921 RepID=A0A9W8ACU9_9FUNG|nr:hypothetical protein IWQ60_002044 [Tieghemiomyces parasiticus]
MADLVAFADPMEVLSQPDSASPKARTALNSVPRFSLETVTPPQRPFPKLPVSDDRPDLEPTSRSSPLNEPHHVPSQDADPLSHRGATYPQRSSIVQPYAPLSSPPAFPLEIKTSPESITLASPSPLPPSPIGPPKTTSPTHKPSSQYDRLVGSLPKPSPIDEALQRCEFSDQSRVVQVAPLASELTSNSIDELPATQPRPSLQSLRSTFSYARTCSISSLDLSPELTPEQLGLMTRVPPLAAVLNPPVRVAAPHLGSMMYPSSPHTVVSQALYPPGPDTFDQSLPVEQNILPEYSSSEFQSQSELDSATSNSDSGHDGSLDDEDDDDEDEAFEIIASHTSSFVESRCSEDRIIGLQKATRVCLSTQSPAGAFPMILTRGSPGPSGYSTPQFHSRRGSALSSLRPPLASSLPDIPPPLLAGATPIAQQLAEIDHQTTERFCDAASDRSATSSASSSFPALPVVQTPQDSDGSSHPRLGVAESAVILLSPVINSHSSQQSVILARSPVRVAHATVHLSLPTRSSFSPPRSPGQSGETLAVCTSPVKPSKDSIHTTPCNETETSPVAAAAASTLPPQISVSPSVSQHRLTPEKRAIAQPNVQLPTPRRSDDGMASKPDAVTVQITTSPPASVQAEQRTAVAFRSTPSLTARLQEAPTATAPVSAVQRSSLKTDAPNRPDPTRAGPSSSAHRKGLPSFLAPASALALESHRTSLGTRTPGQSPPRSLYVPDRLSTISMGAWSDMAQDQAYAAVLSYEWNQMQPRFSAAPSATPPRPSEPPLHGHDDAFTGFESFMAFSFSDDPPSRPTSTGHLSPFRLDGAHTGRRADVAARLRHLAPADVIASSNELVAPTVPPPPPARAPPPGKPAAGSWTTSLSSWWSSKTPATPTSAQPTPAVTATTGPVVRKRPKLSHAHFGRQLCDEVLYLQGERSATAGAGNWTRLWKTRRTRQLFMFSLDLPLNLDEVHSASLGRMIPRTGGNFNHPGRHRVGSATANRITSTILPERFTAQHRPAAPTAATTAAVPLPPLSTSQLSGGSSGAPTPTSGYSPNSSVLALTYTAPMVSLDIENIRRLCSEPQGVLAFLSASELAYLVDHLNLTRKAIKIQTQHFEGKSEQLRNQIATNRAMITDLQPRAAAADPSQLSLPRRRIVVGPSPLLPTSPMSTHDASIASSAARSPFSPTVSSSGWPGSPHQTADAGLYFYQGTAAKQMHHGHGHHHLPSPRSNVTTPGFSPGGPASSTTYPPTTSAGRMSGGIFRVEDEPLASPSPVLSTASRASTSSSISSHHHHHHHPRPRVSDLSTLRPTLTKRPVVYVSHQP